MTAATDMEAITEVNPAVAPPPAPPSPPPPVTPGARTAIRAVLIAAAAILIVGAVGSLGTLAWGAAPSASSLTRSRCPRRCARLPSTRVRSRSRYASPPTATPPSRGST